MAWSKSVTIQQVAAKAGVSIATVSRMLNEQGNVHPDTREKIRRAMDTLGFVPQRAGAAAVRGGRHILAAFPNMSNPFNAVLIRGMRETAVRRGYDILVYRPQSPLDALPVYTDMLSNAYVAGVILAHTVRQVEALEAACREYPLVMCSEYYASDAIPGVSIDDYAAARNAMTYLFSTGRTRVGLLNSALQNNYAAAREAAYREQMAQAGTPVRPGWVVHLPEINFELAVSAATTMLRETERLDAIFCVSDIYAAAVIKAAAALDIAVPETLAVVGFDDIDLASMIVPAITTIAQPTYQLGAQSCNLLLDKIEKCAGMSQRIVLGTELVVRAST